LAQKEPVRSKLLTSMDRILVLREGVIEKLGPPSEIFASASRRAPDAQSSVIAGQILPRG